MATTVIKTYSQAPYYDDFDETKNFHRILFRPGYSVQARELTQLQSLLQAQIDRHGQYAFKDGSRVVDGKVTLNVTFDFVKLSGTTANLSEFVGHTLTGGTSGMTADVLKAVPQSGSDPDTLYVVYTNAGSNNTTTAFANNETLSGGAGGSKTATSAASGATGQGSVVDIEEGVYFIGGNFVYVAGQELLLDKYSNTPNYLVGLQVSETVVDSSTDTSLLDNAQGVPNTAAPGATRYKIGTTLIKQAITTADPAGLVSRADSTDGVNSYVTLLTIKNGQAVIDETDKTLDTTLTDRLARRTFEESGDYSVEPFTVTVKEYLNTGTNNGYRTTAQIIADGLAGNTSAATTYGNKRLALFIEKNVAYVKGHRVENKNPRVVVLEKPRDNSIDLNTVNVATTSLPVGNYVTLTEAGVKGMPDVNEFATIDLHNATAQGGSVIGTARARALEKVGTELRLYLFDVKMTGTNIFSAVRSVNQSGTGQNFVGDLASPGNLFDVGNNGLVFKLPYDAVYTLKELDSNGAETANYDISYIVKQKFETTNGQITVNDTANETFVNVSSISAQLGTAVIDTTPTITGTDGATTLTFTDVGGSAPGSTRLKVMADVQVNLAPNSKTKTTITNQSGSLTNGVYNLGKADIAELTSVTAGGTDITERFTLDNGQRDNFYDLGSISLKPGFADPGTISVSFKYWAHGPGDYFTVNSYRNDSNTTYDEIPAFSSNQGLIHLRDAIDFRPRINNAGNNFDTSGGGANPRAPKPNSSSTTELSHYMPRIDKLYLTKRGEYKIQQGLSDLSPRSPKAPEDSMGVFDLKLSPYIFNVEELFIDPIDNRRYTMRDIGDIDKRVKNLEYYTSLSLLEQSAADVELFDASNFSRTKNGFIVDSFRGHNIGDTSNPDYKCSIDKRNGILRPQFDERNVNLIRKATDNGNCVKNGSIVTMEMESTDVVFVDQPYSSYASNVNPYNVFSWGGMVELSPDSDEWKETDVRPTIFVDDSHAYDQFAQLAEEQGILGTVWNEWETNWQGVEVDTETRNTGGFVPGFEAFEDEWWRRGNPFVGRQRQGNTTITSTTTTSQQSRSGLLTELAFDTVERSDGVRVVEVNFVPFIRSREINFKAQLMKPSTRVYAFFDGVDVSSYVRSETFSGSNPFEFSDRTNVVTHEGVTSHPSSASNLTTSSAGVLEGSFVIPRNDALKFATGVREFRLSDSASNDKSTETTFAEAAYHAQGLLESIEETVVSTKVPRLVTSELNENRTIVDTRVSETTTWIDPVAETFLIDKEGGIFLKSVELFFKKKDANIPVRVTIRPTLNGFPTQKIVPGADKILYPSSVNTSTDASSGTIFSFDYPVYLAQDQEYSIVITAQTDDYEVYVAEMGQFDLTNTDYRIAKQPYNGVFFSSANASTWTPEQSKDLKFKLRRASFKTGQANTITLVNDAVPVRKLQSNPFTMTNGSAVVTVNHKNHGMYESGAQVTLSTGLSSGSINGILFSNLEGNFTISNVTHDSYRITAKNSDTASTTGAGGGTTVTASENRYLDVMYTQIQEMAVPGTLVTYNCKLVNGTSVDGTETAYGLSASGGFSILPNRNYYFTSPKIIASPINENNITALTHGSIEITATMTSTNEALSPVIDMNRASIHTIQNIVGSNGGSEAVSRGGGELSKYITKKVELAEEADSCTVFFNLQRPANSNVKLFYRTLEGGSSSNINDVAFIEATPANPLPFKENGFSEVRYNIDEAVLAAANIGSFGSIQFKIVMTSTSSSRVPKVKDFRAICAT